MVINKSNNKRVIISLGEKSRLRTYFDDLKEGDVFTIIDYCENPREVGQNVFRVTKSPYRNKNGILEVEVEAEEMNEDGDGRD